MKRQCNQIYSTMILDTHSDRAFSTYFIEHAEDDEQIDFVGLLREMSDFFGWTHATYLGTGLNGLPEFEDMLITTYSDAWIHRYNEKDYKLIDPVVSQGTQSLLPLDWSQTRSGSVQMKTFFGEARELGVGRSGLTVAVRGHFGDSSLFSINTDEVGAKWDRRKRDTISDLTYFAHLFHEAVLKQQSVDLIDERPSLTRREQEVLRWAARGKTAWETAKILSLSEKTVSFYLSNAVIKLKVVTKTQAVAKAITQRLLTI